MADYTSNIKLKKPSLDDFYNIQDFNDNMDIIDNELNNKVVKENGKVLSDNNYTSADKAQVAKISTMEANISNKVDKVGGKSLSTNDYSDEEKQKVAKIGTLETTISKKVDKVNGKDLSTNDYTSTDKSQVSKIPNIEKNLVDVFAKADNIQKLISYHDASNCTGSISDGIFTVTDGSTATTLLKTGNIPCYHLPYNIGIRIKLGAITSSSNALSVKVNDEVIGEIKFNDGTFLANNTYYFRNFVYESTSDSMVITLETMGSNTSTVISVENLFVSPVTMAFGS